MLMFTTGNAFSEENKIGTINLQCNECRSEQQYQAKALSALVNRQHAYINVVNFSPLEIRKFEISKLMVEVCSDYNHSASQGVCQLEDRSTIIPLVMQNIEFEKFIAYAEHLYQLNFFQPQQIKVSAEIAATAWALVNSKEDMAQIHVDWKRNITYYQFKKMWFEAYIKGRDLNTPIVNLSPDILFEFADESRLTSVVSGFDSEQRLHFNVLTLQDSNNQLSMTGTSLLTSGDSFQFSSTETQAYQAMSNLALAHGLTINKHQTTSSVEVTLQACAEKGKVCIDKEAIITKNSKIKTAY
ncbi:hypothetical protein [Shewanella sp. 4_MG-2023]|uniref:hypothetical protein n=1 Tax=Shewanella sp. 4_MG-2023 TaxID=3062652 RepID=UPI0026E26E4B|nr:hypothetical protein [Shewanella sp. 4_MG-2023]MDO6679649.1 hypothetical protein [Shewanella sp. 4_MG-2023]